MASQAASQGQDVRLKLSPAHFFEKTLWEDVKGNRPSDATSRTLCAKFNDASRPLFLARQPQRDDEEAARRPWVVLNKEVDGVPEAEVPQFKEAAVSAALQFLQLPLVRTFTAWRHPRRCQACVLPRVAPGARLAQLPPRRRVSLEMLTGLAAVCAPPQNGYASALPQDPPPSVKLEVFTVEDSDPRVELRGQVRVPSHALS